MRIIAELVDLIDEELEGAKDYAEKYVEHKAENNTTWATKFKSMAEDELKHAMNIHEYATMKIDEIKRVYTAPVQMQEKWDKKHKEYIEQTAWIKQMLTM